MGCVVALTFVPREVSLPSIVLTISGAVVIGMLVHRLSSFMHEGAHFNLAPREDVSDVITNLAAGGIVLSDIASYRKIHLAHHRFVGTTNDTERSYFERPDLRFVVRSVTGVSAIKVLRERRRTVGKDESPGLLVPLAGAAAHLLIVGAAVILGWYALAIAWVLGSFSLFPTFNALRQNLEHRRDGAGLADFSEVDQGPFTRRFTGTLGGLLLGGVGFNRHLIHHWDASLSYSNLAEAERFLITTPVADILERRTTSYWRVWRGLLAA